ncbi:MAG: hypothetical protein ACRC4M_01005 [Mycoplasma sp.]
MNTYELKQYIKTNEPALYETIGKHLNNPARVLELLIRHFQWNYQYGNIAHNDMWLRFNDNYRRLFVTVLEDNNDLFQGFIDDILLTFRIAYNDETGTFNTQQIFDILLKNRWRYKYDLVAVYTLIAGNYDEVYELLKTYRPKKFMNMNIRKILRMFKSIITNDFASRLVEAVKEDRKFEEIFDRDVYCSMLESDSFNRENN